MLWQAAMPQCLRPALRLSVRRGTQPAKWPAIFYV